MSKQMLQLWTIPALLLAALLIVAAGCPGDNGSDNSGGDQASPATKEAQQIFKSRCVTCHGEDGKGDGPGAASLDPKPRNYTDKEWQKSVTDEHIHKIIVKGGAAVGKSAGMPPNPDLENKPKVVDELVKIVRSFGEK